MVAMTVWPTDAADGSVANEARWRKMGRVWAPTGVVKGIGGELKPSIVYPNVTIKSGACWVDGHYCELAVDSVITVSGLSGLIVVRFDPVTNSAALVFYDDTLTPTQDPVGMFDLPLAWMNLQTLNDIRGPLLPAGEQASAGYYYRFESNVESADIGTSPQLAVTATIPTVPGHIYDIRFLQTFISRVTGQCGATVQLQINSGLWQYNEVFIFAGSVAVTSALISQWLATPSGNTNPGPPGRTEFKIFVAQAWYSAGPIRTLTAPGYPRTLVITDQGPSR